MCATAAAEHTHDAVVRQKHCTLTIHVVQVVYGHLDDPEGQDIKRGVSYLKLRPGMSTQEQAAACVAVPQQTN